ncbi:MAG: M1 family metallopeptidase [Flavisolibacter sp.]
MNIDMDVETNTYSGLEKLVYTNNSPDSLHRVFFHLYQNAFQPNSMMDVRSRRQGTIIVRRDRNGIEIADWDSRVEDRIAHLQPNEIGYENVRMVKMNGRRQKTQLHETILEVDLDRPLLPNSKATFELEWEGQVPVQIRRSGRDNPTTKVRYSMSQSYPKICEYDYEGWHPTPYIAREFYGVWGDYDVTISINRKYIIAATGYLQNPNRIGYGYEDSGSTVIRGAGEKLKWHFLAPNVHDFMWAADPDFKHVKTKQRDNLTLHVFYKPTNATETDWLNILVNASRAFPYIEKTFGPYPYKQYSFVHGGDGGMEYPMATLLLDPSAWLHELMHSWYQGMLGTNESLYPWMDEGFTNYAAARVRGFLENTPRLETNSPGDYASYYSLARSGKEEPLSTHADHYNTNYAYGNAVYAKGSVFLDQLGYIVGQNNLDKILLQYYKLWRFKHPNAQDFIGLAEKVSDMKLDWYKEYWIYTTKTIDYSIDSLWENHEATNVRIKNLGLMPMPIDVKITFRDGSSEWHYIPMSLMFGQKPWDPGQSSVKQYTEWKWTDATYTINTAMPLNQIRSVEIDPSQRMADIDRRNNKIDLKW